MSIVKNIRRQDSGWKQAEGCSGETSINLSTEIFEYLAFGIIDDGEECGITFRIYKKDFDEAIRFIESQLPLYRSSSRSSEQIGHNHPFLDKLKKTVIDFFGDAFEAEYTVTLYRRKDGRIYLKNLRQGSFTIRDFLVEYSSSLLFEQTDSGFDLRIISSIS